jgi:hypothetical protein
MEFSTYDVTNYAYNYRSSNGHANRAFEKEEEVEEMEKYEVVVEDPSVSVFPGGGDALPLKDRSGGSLSVAAAEDGEVRVSRL